MREAKYSPKHNYYRCEVPSHGRSSAIGGDQIDAKGIRSHMKLTESRVLFERATKVMPKGVSSDARAKRELVVFDHGNGSKLYDVDGNEFLDYSCHSGACIHGHTPSFVMDAVRRQIERGSLLDGTTREEILLAEKIHELVPSAEMVRFCVSGTEASMHAIRLARGLTGKRKILKFEGHFHGNHDYALVGYDLSRETKRNRKNSRRKASKGTPPEISRLVEVVPWNDIQAFENSIRENRKELACVIMEPIMSSAAVIEPRAEYLKVVRELTQHYDVFLIFDEVLTGFRVALGGAQSVYGVTPDISLFSKALGGGYPISAVAGLRDVLQGFGPGQIRHAGTYNAAPLCVAAALASLTALSENGASMFRKLHTNARTLRDGISAAAKDKGIGLSVQGIGPLFSIYFATREIRNHMDHILYPTIAEKGAVFAKETFARGLWRAGSPHRWVLSTSHTEDDIQQTISFCRDIFSEQSKALSC